MRVYLDELNLFDVEAPSELFISYLYRTVNLPFNKDGEPLLNTDTIRVWWDIMSDCMRECFDNHPAILVSLKK